MTRQKDAKFKIGDSVRIKNGQTDEDFGVDISGWQGRIVEFYPQHKTCLINLDSITLKNMLRIYLESSEAEGYDWSQYVIELKNIELVKSRDTEEDVAEVAAELESSLGMSWLGEEGRAMNAIMGGAVGELEQVMAWHDYLEKHLTFPFNAKVSEWQGRGSKLKVDDGVKVTALHDHFDEHYGVFVKIKQGRYSYDFPLCDLEVAPPSAPQHDLVQLYAVWFANR